MPREKKCGCASDLCGCVVQNTSSVEVDGLGTEEEPFALGGIFPLIVENTPTLTLEAVPNDTGLSLSAYPSAGLADVQTFTSNGLWTKPAWATRVRVLIIGGGGGGCSGVSDGLGNPSIPPAPGGDGGSVTIVHLEGTDVPASAAVVVGDGGAGGGAAHAAPWTAVYNAGFPGQPSSWGPWRADGGIGGDVDLPDVQNSVGGTQLGGHAPDDMLPITGVPGGLPRLVPGAGGRGGTDLIAPWLGQYAVAAAGRRVLPSSLNGESVVSGSAGANGPGDDGINETVSMRGSGGGGGDAGGSEGYHGGNGGLYGGGGGGGGAGVAGMRSGSGGLGAPGIVQVISW